MIEEHLQHRVDAAHSVASVSKGDHQQPRE
jgi:hypothetical protein